MRQFVDLGQLGAVREFVEGAAGELGMDPQVVDSLRLAVDEACTNIVEHAYQGRGGDVEVTIEAKNGEIQIVLRDWGLAFDPQAIPAPDVTAPLEQRPIGGLGLFLMQQMMDKVDFWFDAEQGNTLTMIKRI